MDVKENFHKQGFLLLEGFYNQEDISELSGIIDPILKQWLEKSRSEVIEHNLINMHSLTHPSYFSNKNEERIQFFISLTPPTLTNWLDNLFGEGIYFHNTQLFLNPTNTSQLPYWHRDLQYSPIEDARQAREHEKPPRTACQNSVGRRNRSGVNSRNPSPMGYRIRTRCQIRDERPHSDRRSPGRHPYSPETRRYFDL